MAFMLMIFGTVLLFIGSIMIVVEAFSESILWGLGSLLVPFVALIFVAIHWDETKKGLFIALSGFALIFIASGMAE